MENRLVGLVVGVLLGVPASYYLQSSVVRAKVSLLGYLKNLPELVTKYPGDIGLPVLLACVIFGAVGWFVGGKLLRRADQ